uniref:NR LBD domain-containing protein n=1 Tax=Megaselia scalaris TaxID=36166 RepID=T1H219_MEGSC
MVSWTKKLPFYLEIPVEIHTKLLTDKWHELLILTTAAYQALHGKKSHSSPSTNLTSSSSTTTTNTTNIFGTTNISNDDPDFTQEVSAHLSTLQTCLTTLMGQPITMEQLKLDVGHMVEKMTQISIMFRRIKLRMEEYVCLKVYILLNKGIMTLSRGPYSELDKMSLFQDLKLKRRKIDSRCSSDGESIADTSTSSPDLLAPLSPKMCDEETRVTITSISSASTPVTSSLLIPTTNQTTQSQSQQQQQQQLQNKNIIQQVAASTSSSDMSSACKKMMSSLDKNASSIPSSSSSSQRSENDVNNEHDITSGAEEGRSLDSVDNKPSTTTSAISTNGIYSVRSVDQSDKSDRSDLSSSTEPSSGGQTTNY